MALLPRLATQLTFQLLGRFLQNSITATGLTGPVDHEHRPLTRVRLTRILPAIRVVYKRPTNFQAGPGAVDHPALRWRIGNTFDPLTALARAQ